jgi:SsrA-binding protein
MAKQNQANFQPVIKNRQAEFQYFLLERFQAGLVLTGTEIKSIRLGKVQLQDAYCLFQGGELWIRNMQISPYEQGNIYNHDPKRARKLLLTARELKKLKTRVEEKGLTIIPVKIYFSERNLAKLEIALAKGKKFYDKRESLKEKDVKRSLERDRE